MFSDGVYETSTYVQQMKTYENHPDFECVDQHLRIRLAPNPPSSDDFPR